MDWEDKNASLSLESTENPTHLLLKLAIGVSGEQSLKSVQLLGTQATPCYWFYLSRKPFCKEIQERLDKNSQ